MKWPPKLLLTARDMLTFRYLFNYKVMTVEQIWLYPFKKETDIGNVRKRLRKFESEGLVKVQATIFQGKIDLVMVSEISRISRNMKDFSEIWELMKKHNCGFYSLRENFDTTTAAGEMVLYTIASIAQFERRQVSERVSANIKARAKRGLYNGGSVPLGFKLGEKKGYLELDHEMANLVRLCFSTYLKKESLSQTAKYLNDQGHTIRRWKQGF